MSAAGRAALRERLQERLRESRRASEARRAVLRAEFRTKLAEKTAAARAELERRRAALAAKRPRRRRWWRLLPLLLLLLLLRDCEPTVEPVAEVAVPAAPVVGEGEPAERVAPPKRVARRDRPTFVLEDPGPLPWLDALRLQVAARGPRLAACLVGSAQPGALRWTAAVDAATGRVSDQDLEPILGGEPLTPEQEACAMDVLAEPEYRLEGASDQRGMPVRVGVVLEF